MHTDHKLEMLITLDESVLRVRTNPHTKTQPPGDEVRQNPRLSACSAWPAFDMQRSPQKLRTLVKQSN